MRILLIRHGDPDYINDCLTEKGRREASLLADLMEKETVKDFFVSPLGRARETASYTLKRLKRTAEEKDWLREFPAKLEVEDSVWLQKAYPDTRKEDGRFQTRIVWDMLPAFWKEDPAYQTPEGWRNTEVAAHSDLNQAYGRVDRRSAGKVRLQPGGPSLPDRKGEPGYHSLFLPFRRQLCDPVPSVERLPLCAVAQPGYGSHLCDRAVHGRAAERDCRVSGLPDRGSLPSVRGQRAGFFFRPVLRNL